MQNDTPSESPVVLGKGKAVGKVPPETEMEVESRKSEGDSSPPTMESATPMGCLKTRSTPALIAAKKSIPISRARHGRSKRSRGYGRSTRGRSQGGSNNRKGTRTIRGKGGVILTELSDNDTPNGTPNDTSNDTPNDTLNDTLQRVRLDRESKSQVSRNDLLLSLRVLSGTHDTPTPPSVIRMCNDYNSVVTSELQQLLMLYDHTRGSKRSSPGSYPNQFNEHDVTALRRFVDDNRENIKRLESIISFLQEIQTLGEKAVNRVSPDTEKGGSTTVQLPKDGRDDGRVCTVL